MNTEFDAEHAYLIAAICLFCTGHWIGGVACALLAFHVGDYARRVRSPADLPEDDAALPPIDAKPATPASPVAAQPADAWPEDGA